MSTLIHRQLGFQICSVQLICRFFSVRPTVGQLSRHFLSNVFLTISLPDQPLCLNNIFRVFKGFFLSMLIRFVGRGSSFLVKFEHRCRGGSGLRAVALGRPLLARSILYAGLGTQGWRMRIRINIGGDVVLKGRVERVTCLRSYRCF